MANIRDVAKKANVSIGSVSRVLNNDTKYKITEKTKQKILEVAKELNYVLPDKKNKAHNFKIGVIKHITDDGTKDSYYDSILSGIKSYLNDFGYSIDYLQSQYELEQNIMLEGDNIDGLIIMDTPTPQITNMLKSKIKHIVGIDTQIPNIDNIRYDRYEAGCIAMQYLINQGHKKIAYIGSNIPDAYRSTLGRYDAYNRMMQKYNLPIKNNYILSCNWRRKICYDKTLALLNSGDIPTAIFASSDHMAIAAMSAINSMHLSIPKDISIIGISNIELSTYLTPPLTTVAIPQYELGRIAAKTLLDRIKGDNTIAKQIYVPTNLVIRQSVASPIDKE